MRLQNSDLNPSGQAISLRQVYSWLERARVRLKLSLWSEPDGGALLYYVFPDSTQGVPEADWSLLMGWRLCEVNRTDGFRMSRSVTKKKSRVNSLMVAQRGWKEIRPSPSVTETAWTFYRSCNEVLEKFYVAFPNTTHKCWPIILEFRSLIRSN